MGKSPLERGEIVLQKMILLEGDLDLLHGLDSGWLVIESGPFSVEISLGKSVAGCSKIIPR